MRSSLRAAVTVAGFVALVGTGLPACSGGTTPLTMASGLVPEIDDLEASPRSTTSKDQSITLVASGHGLAGKPVTYHWTASAGLLNATTGQTVVWRPTGNEGQIDAGPGSIGLTVTVGGYSTGAKLNFVINADGSVVTGSGLSGFVPGSTAPGFTVSTPGPSAAASAATPASGATTAVVSSPSVCTLAGTGLPATVVAPGALLVVQGRGIPSAAAIALDGAALPTTKVGGGAIAALVPALTDVSVDPHLVELKGCTPVSPGKVIVTSTEPFGGLVTQPGQGLLAEYEQLPDTVDQVPDLAKLVAAGSFLAADFDVSATLVGAGLPVADAYVTSNLAIRYTGTLTVPTGGDTTFTLVATDGAKLYLDDKLVVDAEPGSPFSGVGGKASLTAGPHPLRLDYVLGTNPTVDLQLSWALPGGAKAIVPASAYSHDFGL